MTKDEAEKVLREYDAYLDRRNVQAHFASTSLGSWDMELSKKVEIARVVLGMSQWQRSYKQLLRDHPTLPLCIYLKRRIK